MHPIQADPAIEVRGNAAVADRLIGRPLQEDLPHDGAHRQPERQLDQQCHDQNTEQALSKNFRHAHDLGVLSQYILGRGRRELIRPAQRRSGRATSKSPQPGRKSQATIKPSDRRRRLLTAQPTAPGPPRIVRQVLSARRACERCVQSWMFFIQRHSKLPKKQPKLKKNCLPCAPSVYLLEVIGSM